VNLAIELSYLKVNLDIELIPIHPKVNPAPLLFYGMKFNIKVNLSNERRTVHPYKMVGHLTNDR
jgi:hypothetical protein